MMNIQIERGSDTATMMGGCCVILERETQWVMVLETRQHVILKLRKTKLEDRHTYTFRDALKKER
jgi:hypothetical protein